MEWATELLREFREHEKSGKGAFTFRGQMIVRMNMQCIGVTSEISLQTLIFFSGYAIGQTSRKHYSNARENY